MSCGITVTECNGRALRIPMRGYESVALVSASVVCLVTNPHEGL